MGDVLGRALRLEEVEAFTGIARRIAALVLREDALDAAYETGRDPSAGSG